MGVSSKVYRYTLQIMRTASLEVNVFSNECLPMRSNERASFKFQWPYENPRMRCSVNGKSSFPSSLWSFTSTYSNVLAHKLMNFAYVLKFSHCAYLLSSRYFAWDYNVMVLMPDEEANNFIIFSRQKVSSEAKNCLINWIIFSHLMYMWNTVLCSQYYFPISPIPSYKVSDKTMFKL